MKNLKRLLGLMAISGFAFGFAGNVNALKADTVATVTDTDGQVHEYTTVFQAIKGVLTNKDQDAVKNVTSNKIVLEKDGVYTHTSGNQIINSTVTIDLNGHDITIDAETAHGFIIEDKGKFEITGSGSIIMKDAGSTLEDSLFNVSTGATVTVGKNVNIDYTGSLAEHEVFAIAGGTVTFNGAITAAPKTAFAISNAKGTNLTLNATTVKSEENIVNVDVAATKTNNAIINVKGGEYTSVKGGLVSNGYATWNITGGKVTANMRGVVVNKGIVNISKDATIISKNDTAIDMTTDTEDRTINITGGTVTTEGDDKYAVLINGEKGTFTISDGKLNSGEDTKDTESEVIHALPAIKITNASSKFLTSHAGMLTGGHYLYAVVDDVDTTDSSHYTGEAAQKYLVKEGYEVTVDPADKNYKVISKVGTPTDEPSTTEPGTTTPGTTDKPGTSTGDETTSKNPNTYDGIMSYVTLAISSLGALGFATKKVLF